MTKLRRCMLAAPVALSCFACAGEQVSNDTGGSETPILPQSTGSSPGAATATDSGTAAGTTGNSGTGSVGEADTAADASDTGESGDTGATGISDASVSAAQAEQDGVTAATTQVFVVLHSTDSVNSLVTGVPPTRHGPDPKCASVITERAPPSVTIEFTGESGCAVSAGTIVVSSVGSAGDRHTEIAVGRPGSPVAVNGYFVQGTMRMQLEPGSGFVFGTADASGAFLRTNCQLPEVQCFSGCKIEAGATSCAAEHQVEVGLFGSGTTTKKLNPASVEVVLLGSGEVYSPMLGGVQSLGLGSLAADLCPGEGFVTAMPWLYLLTPESLDLECACPQSGASSVFGGTQIKLQYDCNGDNNPDFPMTVDVSDRSYELDFGVGTCHDVQVSDCGTGQASISFEHANFSQCGITELECASLKALGGCALDNRGCTDCTGTINLGDLASSEGALAMALSNDLATDMADLSQVLAESTTALCSPVRSQQAVPCNWFNDQLRPVKETSSWPSQNLRWRRDTGQSLRPPY